MSLANAIEELRTHKDVLVLSDHPTDIPNIPCGNIGHALFDIAIGAALEGKTPVVLTNKPYTLTTKENITIISTQPGPQQLTVIVPADNRELSKATIAAGLLLKPVHIRIPPDNLLSDRSFTIGRSELLRRGNDATIIACGPAVHNALIAAKQLSQQDIKCTVINNHTINPLDKHRIITSARTGIVITADNHDGLAHAVAHTLSTYHPTYIKSLTNATAVNIVTAVNEAIHERCLRAQTTIQPSHPFHIHSGMTIHTITELIHALLDMDHSTFAHHCTKNKNDFSAWLHEHPPLARALKKKRTPISMANALSQWLEH